MKPIAVVYVSETGHTKAYAGMLAEKTGMSCYSLQQAQTALAVNAPVVYMGWLMAGRVKDYAAAARRFKVLCVAGVGVAPHEELAPAVRRAHRIPAAVPVFTLCGGIERGKLEGVYASMIRTLIRALSLRRDRSEKAAALLQLLQHDGSRVEEQALQPLLAWYENA